MTTTTWWLAGLGAFTALLCALAAIDAYGSRRSYLSRSPARIARHSLEDAQSPTENLRRPR